MEAAKRPPCVSSSFHSSLAFAVKLLRYGIGLGAGRGATPQMAEAQGGSGVGVGIREPFPCLDGEQFGSVAGSHVIQLPVKVSLLG